MGGRRHGVEGGRFYLGIQSFIALAGDQQEDSQALQRSRGEGGFSFALQENRLRGKKRTFWISESYHKPSAMIRLQNNISKCQNFGETYFPFWSSCAGLFIENRS